jgi:hypothetical protein
MVIRIFNSYEEKIGQTIIYRTSFICKYHKNYGILYLYVTSSADVDSKKNVPTILYLWISKYFNDIFLSIFMNKEEGGS